MSRHAGLALLLALVALTALATLAIGAEPSASPTALFEGGDPRSEGEGPGLVGSPLLILLGVVLLGVVLLGMVLLGVVTAGATVLIVRLAGRD